MTKFCAHLTGKPVIKWSADAQEWYPTAYGQFGRWDHKRVEALRRHVNRLNSENGK